MLASQETLRSFAVCYLFFLSALVPAGVVVGLLYACRKMSARAINIFNLVFAVGATLFALLCIINDMIGINWGAFSIDPPAPPRPLNPRDCVVVLVLLSWAAGAVGLFFRKRLAWAGSIVGVGAAVSFFTSCLIGIVVACLYPDAGMNNARNFDGFGGAGHILAMVTVLTEFSLLLAICIRLFFGLLQVRKEIFTSYNSKQF
jgi:hypothetical protein